MKSHKPFWQIKPLQNMSPSEWESLCDGCGRCCLQKLQDDESEVVYYTAVACCLLDTTTCQCSDYRNRKELVPECIKLSVKDIPDFKWLPDTCAYRLLSEGKSLKAWHPLVSGNKQSVHQAGISVRAFAISEKQIPEEDWEEYLIPLTPC